MSSAVDICNLALSHLGDSASVASIDPPENSAQAAHCARFYPMARDRLLQMHPWSFAVRREALALLVSEAAMTTWQYAYAAPNDLLTMLSVLAEDASDETQTEAFDREAMAGGAEVILTNQEDAVGRFTVRVTDPARFSPLFVDCLSWLLASDLAGPVVKGDAGAKAARDCHAIFRERFMHAARTDSNQRRATTEHTAGWITARA